MFLTHVLWFRSQEPGYHEKQPLIFESQQLKSTRQAKQMCPAVYSQWHIIIPRGMHSGTAVLASSFSLRCVINEMLLGLELWSHGYRRGHVDWDNGERQVSMVEDPYHSPSSPVWIIESPPSVNSFMLFLWSTSLNNCHQHLEDQDGKVSSIQYTMLDLCIAEIDWLCLDPSMQKTHRFLFVCLFCFRTDTSICLSRFRHSLLFSVKHHSSPLTGHGTCWVLNEMERGERIMHLLLRCGLSSSMTTWVTHTIVSWLLQGLFLWVKLVEVVEQAFC